MSKMTDHCWMQPKKRASRCKTTFWCTC